MSLEKKLQTLESRMRDKLSSDKDAALIRLLLETLIDIREAFEEFNRFFKIDIDLDKLDLLQPKEIEYSDEWATSLERICEVLISLYSKIDKQELAEKWQRKLRNIKSLNKTEE